MANSYLTRIKLGSSQVNLFLLIYIVAISIPENLGQIQIIGLDWFCQVYSQPIKEEIIRILLGDYKVVPAFTFGLREAKTIRPKSYIHLVQDLSLSSSKTSCMQPLKVARPALHFAAVAD